MKKIFFFIPMVLVLLICCKSVPVKKRVDEKQPYLEISFSFNTENYPWLLGTKYPQMAVWVKCDTMKPETIFVTQGAGEDKWMFADKRPGALPVWSGVRPAENGMKLDAVTGATPSGESYAIVWMMPPEYMGRKITLYIEANVSFDYNDFYSKEEGSPGFSGVNGQPSVVWRAVLTPGDMPVEITPEIIGHGNVLGKTSAIDPDMSHISTASELFHYIRISYHPGN